MEDEARHENKHTTYGRWLVPKEVRLVYGDGSRTTRSEATPVQERGRFSLTDDEVLKLARWACLIEDHHYLKQAGHAQPMNIEWAKDFPEFARWLVEQGITSISLNPDVAIKTHLLIADEKSLLCGAEPVKSESPTVVVLKLSNESLAAQQSTVGRSAPPQSN